MSQQEELIIQYIPRLRRYARALLNDAERAEDLVQETLMRALGSMALWRRGSDMRAWLFTIMHNQYVNDCRRAQKRPDAQSLDEAGALESHASSSADQFAGLDDIEVGLMRLPENQRAVLLLVSLEGLSYRQTAKVLGIRLGTVMSRLHRARERMRSWLYALPESPGPRIRRVK